MAKQPSSRGGTTRVRFLMLEAEGAESDLAQIFAAIQSAVKPSTTIIQQRLAATPADQNLVTDGSADDAAAEEVLNDGMAAFEKPRKNKPKTLRKPTTPDVLDLDFHSDLSLKSFVDAHNTIDADVDRYLSIAAWFKEHRDTPTITTAHIYTGYRIMEWPVGIEDFGAILRYLKS